METKYLNEPKPVVVSYFEVRSVAQAGLKNMVSIKYPDVYLGETDTAQEENKIINYIKTNTPNAVSGLLVAMAIVCRYEKGLVVDINPAQANPLVAGQERAVSPEEFDALNSVERHIEELRSSGAIAKDRYFTVIDSSNGEGAE